MSTGMGDLQGKLLTVAEAKKRKADIVLQSRQRQKLLQAEQPKLIECTAACLTLLSSVTSDNLSSA